jgi:hypothetical protein
MKGAKARLSGLFFLVLAAGYPLHFAFAWGRYPGGYHPPHQNPVVVHRGYVEHGPRGCVGCGVGAAVVGGLVGGAIVGGIVAGSAPPPPTYVIQAPPPGTEVAVLPAGCTPMNVNGGTYYQCGPVWYQPFFGGNGVYYNVVPAP